MKNQILKYFIWRVIDLIQWAESFFKERSLDKPRAEIEWLLCYLLGCERLDLYLRYDEPLSQAQLETLRIFFITFL